MHTLLIITMTSGAVDYTASYFKFKTPMPIIGTPTHKTLKRLKQELRANASSVESDLGGGDHGHLGLVLIPAEYSSISATAYLCLTHHSPNPVTGNTKWENQVN